MHQIQIFLTVCLCFPTQTSEFTLECTQRSVSSPLDGVPLRCVRWLRGYGGPQQILQLTHLFADLFLFSAGFFRDHLREECGGGVLILRTGSLLWFRVSPNVTNRTGSIANRVYRFYAIPWFWVLSSFSGAAISSTSPKTDAPSTGSTTGSRSTGHYLHFF